MATPLFGAGLGSFEWAYGPHRTDHMQWLGQATILDQPMVSAGVAHNEFLQIGVELGLIGLGLALAVLYLVLKDSTSHARWAVLSIGIMCTIEFPLTNPATALVFAVALGLCSRDRDGRMVS